MIALVNGSPLGYDDFGTGIPVVFIHGFPHDRALWAAQLGALPVPARTLACDLRGFGETRGDATSVDDYADDIAAWMHGIGIHSAVFVGLSMGGYVAFALWRRHPTLIRALVLASTRAGADDEAGKAKRTAQIAAVHERGSVPFADQALPGMLGKTTRDERPEIAERVHAMLARASVGGIVGALAAMRDRPDSTPTLATITVPTLIVAGDEDALIPLSQAHIMHDGIARSRLEVIAGAGHLPNVERPASFNHVLGEFLASLLYS